MQVIRKGPPATIECPDCKSTLLYTADDVQDDVSTGTWITCCECGRMIPLDTRTLSYEMRKHIKWDG